MIDRNIKVCISLDNYCDLPIVVSVIFRFLYYIVTGIISNSWCFFLTILYFSVKSSQSVYRKFLLNLSCWKIVWKFIIRIWHTSAHISINFRTVSIENILNSFKLRATKFLIISWLTNFVFIIRTTTYLFPVILRVWFFASLKGFTVIFTFITCCKWLTFDKIYNKYCNQC